jgi:UDP-glucose 4-epimerase
MAKPTYLILGANGFVGSYLVEHFARKGLVRAFDRFERPPQFKANDNIEVIKGDMFSNRSLKAAVKGSTYVLHSFSASTPFTSDNDPYGDITRNLLRSVQLFEMCVKAGIKRVGFISSGGAVYGTTAEKKVVDEDDAPLPVSPYGINKLAIEHYLEYFKRKHGLEYVAYRLTNPYGPRHVARGNQGVIPIFLDKIRNDEGITVFGNGTMSRDYIYIEDAIRMIVTSFERGKHTLYNIGRGEQTSLNDIINELRDLLDKEVRVTYKEAPRTFLQRTDVSIDRFCEEFGCPKFVSLHDGISKFIAAQS